MKIFALLIVLAGIPHANARATLQPCDSMEANPYMNFTKPKIATKTMREPMSPALVRRVEQIYAKTIANAKQSNQMGLDGTSYIFSTSNGACGLAWSPDSRSQNGRLVELLQRLETHAGLSTQIGLQSSEKSIAELLRTMERD